MWRRNSEHCILELFIPIFKEEKRYSPHLLEKVKKPVKRKLKV